MTGVEADDLLINGEGAVFVTGSGAGPYVFTFTQPPSGTVNIAFDSDHGIVSQAGTGLFPGATWSYTLTDTIAPIVSVLTPAASSMVGSLTQVEVVFSEPVTGVDAADLTINSTPATSVTGSDAGPYVFTFPTPPTGAVNFAWASGHGIVDTAAVPNAFAGGAWTATLSATGPGTVVINEFLASNGIGVLDENAEQEDWIELKNTGTTAVNLVGWALTDDPADLGKWVFPSRTISAGGYLVVFASGKNRKPGSGNLHTSFTINENGGYLALVAPQSPRVAVSAFNYPEQRTDYSYGPQVSDGALRYFLTPTVSQSAPPIGAANGNSTLTALTAPVNVSVGRGYFKDAFQLVLSSTEPGATIRYTTNFTEPTASVGTVYTGPITISSTTCLRAVAIATGKIASRPVTHSYIFLDQVLTQPAAVAGFPTDWGTGYGTNVFSPASSTAGLVPADYAMDTDPIRVTPNNPASAIDPVKQQMLKDGLRELPLLSVTIAQADMFASTGLYAYPNVITKAFAYKKCAVEMILPDGSTAFSEVCGIGGHGNASRDPLKNPKHGFQLKFKGDYGAGSLNYQLYPDSPVQDFDDIILRPDFNSSWRHWSDATNVSGNLQRTRATRTRDAFVKDTFRAMGGPGSYHRFFHLFLNGLYWGVYDFAEQPVEGFGKSYLGGNKSDYDVIHEGVVRAGDAIVYNAMSAVGGGANITTPALYEQMKSYLDMTEFIDYTLLHFYIAHQDWGTTKNWYAIRRRASANNPTQGKFQYIPWDSECTLLDSTLDQVNGDVANLGRPTGLHPKLVGFAQYKLDFADRVHRHMVAPGGALTTAPMISRWQKWQAVLDKPIIAESCRWGDYRRDFHNYSTGAYVLYTREDQWLAEHARMAGAGGYFTTRPSLVLSQLQTAGLYPALLAPEYRLTTTAGPVMGTSQVTAGTLVAMNRPGGAGTLYFTTDGNDPHIYYTPTTGATATSVAPTAQTYSAPIAINATTTIKSRILNGGVWSALNEATFTVGVALPAVRITEIMYNPTGGTAYEFVELQNVGATTVDMSSWSFDGIDFLMPLGTTLNPGGRVIIANNDGSNGLFAARYPGTTPLGYFSGSLDNNGERIGIHDASGRTIVSVFYDDTAPWPVTADGGGFSLEIIDPLGDPDSYANWKASAVLKGTPGQANSTQPATAIVLNEVLAVNTGSVLVGGEPVGYVELKNMGGTSLDLNGWKIEGSAGTYTFGAGSNISAGGFAVVSCGGTSGLPIALNRAGGVVRLRNASGAYVDSVSFGNQIADRAVGRIASAWTLTNPTVAQENDAAALAPAAGNLVINEWLSNAAPGSADWLEVYNKNASQPVALGGLYFTAGAQLYRYPSLSFVAPLKWLQFFCDELPGFDHLDFKLPASGTTLSILDSSATAIDTIAAVDFGNPGQGISRGRTTDGAATFTTFTTTSSPGAANYVNSWTGPVINEVLARNSTGDLAPWNVRADWIELYNPGAAPFNLAGVKLATTADGSGAWTFPAGSSIPALGYLQVWCDAGRSADTALAADMNSALNLGDQSGALYLFNTNSQIVDRAVWGPQLVDRSFGLDAGVQKLLATPTRGAANSAAATLGLATGIKINEWLAAPVGVAIGLSCSIRARTR